MRLFIVTVATLLLLVSPVVRAQHNAYFLPVERGHLYSKVDLQLHYSSFDIGSLFGGSGATYDVVFFSLEAQAAVRDRFEIGLNIPLITYTSLAFGGGTGGDEVHFGDMILNLKVRLVGNEKKAFSIFANTRLPTHSWEGSREYAVVHFGGAFSSILGNLRAGGVLDFLAVAADVEDPIVVIGLNSYFGYKVLGVLVLQLAMQFHNSLSPNGELTSFALIPGVDLEVGGFRLGLASRIAVSDDAEIFYAGRASLMFHGGAVF